MAPMWVGGYIISNVSEVMSVRGKRRRGERGERRSYLVDRTNNSFANFCKRVSIVSSVVNLAEVLPLLMLIVASGGL